MPIALSEHAADLLTASMTWMDARWDEEVGLLIYAPDPGHAGRHAPIPGVRHGVRDTVWYALGLLQRDAPGDRDRACRAVSAILDWQFDEPGRPYHGTFYRAPEEAHPPADAVRWEHYDPNWRQFIGTALAILLEEYPAALPPDLVRRIDRAVRLAIEGEEGEGRLTERYTNIALMRAPFEMWAGTRYSQPEWRARGEAWAETIHRRFGEHGAYDEYNSPTYYGTDLFALGFWRHYAPTPRLQSLAEEMEAALWRDIAGYYHAGLRNICGPYARSYGMDMTRYVALLGQAIWIAAGRALAPHPDPTGPMEHTNDFMYPPALTAVGVRVPEDALPALRAFPGPHRVERHVGSTPIRVATAWLDEDVMIGAAGTDGQRPAGRQFHPLTVHWRLPEGGVGWMRMVAGDAVDARADEGQAHVTCAGDAVLEVYAPGATAADVGGGAWSLPGLEVRVEARAEGLAIDAEDDSLFIRYPGASSLTLSVTTR